MAAWSSGQALITKATMAILLPYLALPLGALAASSATEVTVLHGTKTGNLLGGDATTGSYLTYASTMTIDGSVYSEILSSLVGNETSVSGVAEATVTQLTGSITSPTGNSSASSTAADAAPTNRQPCNGYPELCGRKYGNITMVGTHNSPFTRPGSAASNQELDVTTQLNDGVRFLQAQMHWSPNDTIPHFCHSSCDMLDAGPITDWLGKVKRWVDRHPYDVVTILLGNGDYSPASKYAPFIESTGILHWAYVPPKVPMSLNDWPSLASMILSGKRVIMFMDYVANQTAYPWLLDEFSQMWETPFDPVDTKFPCTVQRPPNLAPDAAKNRLYLANHNLNVEVSLLGASILVPAVTELERTNNVTGEGSLGLAANNCASDWGRPPNILNVDYYNYGGFPGSVFEVAAQMNNVTWNGKCCGRVANIANIRTMAPPVFVISMAALAALLLL